MRADARLKFIGRQFQENKNSLPDSSSDPEPLRNNECSVVTSVQNDVFSAEFQSIGGGIDIPRSSIIRSLCSIALLAQIDCYMSVDD